ncbi:MAG TPA: glucose-1-phosphate thymidylyltransferase [Bacillota bacterium]|nr:glucose-1-phosphate thymidylyltransferase [Bacillota bacterium]HOB86978.1 glucose-1-phosphate thymidylyltransferase [Bacillota bacterium]HOP69085.1 glucose-1-phosphate thymidylyltransferase [Bacillota bacterium]HPT34308.1 glucose-1-phosphate thymidylyltransferase [Bacillota bacterium]HPZ64280.1 glucose-1-phosphate thymidylyltransferase [Bacillota bacterium]
MLKPRDFFDLAGNPFASLFDGIDYVWEALKKLKPYIEANLRGNVADVRRGGSLILKTVVLDNGKVLESGFTIDTTGKKPVVIKNGTILEGASIIFAGASLMDDRIYIGKGTVVEPGALIKGPTIIGDNTEIRQGAYIRGETLVGNDCVVGHATEVKSSVLLGGSKAGHFAYIGDSILGRVNLGAGTKLANLKLVDSQVVLEINGIKYETRLKKFGAILGDGVETGCNSVTSPGTLLSKNVLLYPNCTARGYYPPHKLIKVKQIQEPCDKK